MDFIPFDATEEEIVERAVLRPGVPAGMRKPLIAWLHEQMSADRGFVYVSRLHELENQLDVTFGLNPDFSGLMKAEETRSALNKLSERDLLRAADYFLFKSWKRSGVEQSLGGILRAGRSMYTPVEHESGFRMGRRAPEGVQDAAEALGATDDAPGRLLKTAWTKVLELKPDDSGAYAAAVKAVEAASFAALDITDDLPTLGNSIRAIEKKEATWGLPFKREHTNYPSRDVLLGMLKSLYKGHRDRHGSEAYSDVTHDEAYAAVLMAVTLVGWFSAGLVQERDTAAFG